MRVNFFEEYPTEENLSKLSLIHFPSTLFVAAHSLSEFRKLEQEICNRFPNIEVAYWPILPHSYWISPFSYTKELDTFFEELKSEKRKKKLKILVDLELPISHDPYFKNILHFFRNKKRIKRFFNDAPEHGIEIYTAEYPNRNVFFQMLWRLLGISLSYKYPHTKIFMCYSSMIEKSLGKSTRQAIHAYTKKLLIKHPGRGEVAFGTIAIGVQGNEPILSPEKLDRDFSFYADSNPTVTIFRLGGLTEENMVVINKYTV